MYFTQNATLGLASKSPRRIELLTLLGVNFEIITNILIGYYFFDHFPDYWTFFGLFVIISSGIYIFRRELKNS